MSEYELSQDDVELGLSYIATLKTNIAHDDRLSRWLHDQTKPAEVGFKIPVKEIKKGRKRKLVMINQVKYDFKNASKEVDRPASDDAQHDTE